MIQLGEAFGVPRSTLFLWKRQFIKGGKIPEALNEKKRSPRIKRKRIWDLRLITEIKHQRDLHPNIGKDKLHILIQPFCEKNGFPIPSVSTIGRLIKDCGGLRMFPRKVRHNGKIVPIKRKKVIRKPKDFKALYAGYCVALDTVERFVHGLRRYIITFEDIHTRFVFAWGTTSHASLAAKEFFECCMPEADTVVGMVQYRETALGAEAPIPHAVYVNYSIGKVQCEVDGYNFSFILFPCHQPQPHKSRHHF